MNELHKEFSPGLFHPYYFVRQGIKEGIKKHSGQLSGSILDFGCGSKPYRSFFKYSEYVGVDFENEGHPHVNEQIDVFYDGVNLPFPKDRFDSIICSEVFEHIFNLDIVLAELNRVLKTGGNILITCPFVWNEHEVPFDFARYTQFALKDFLNRHGFEILDYSKAGNFTTARAQLTTLYYKNAFQGWWRKIFVLRWCYKICFFFLPNFKGKILAKWLPADTSLYLNNIVLAKKVSDKTISK